MVTSDWIPFFQTLAWILFISIILLLTRRQVAALLTALIRNVQGGASVKFPWLEVGPQVVPIQSDDLDSESSPIYRIRSVFLAHSVGPWEMWNDGKRRRSIDIWADSFYDEVKDKIEKVTFYLPSSFPDRVRPKTKQEGFSTHTAAYGEFVVGAEVQFKGEAEPRRINRYINFYDGDIGES